MMTLFVGQKVICVNAGMVPQYGSMSYGIWDPDEALIDGHIYTIRRVYIYCEEYCVWLNEIARSDFCRRLYGDDIGYGAARFRPVKATDISIFHQILAPSPKKAREPA